MQTSVVVSAPAWRTRLGALAGWARAPVPQVVALALVAIALLLPHLGTPLARDEADYVAAARAVAHRGIPVFYQSDVPLASTSPVAVRHLPGFPGLSSVFVGSDGNFTWVEHGGIAYKVGNWHPPLYLYLLAPALALPLPLQVAARLVNLALLLATLALLYALARHLASARAEGNEAPPAWYRDWLPFAVCAVFLAFSFGARSALLVDSTTTLAPLSVVLFWYLHLRLPRSGLGTAIRAVAIALVAWSNLGPVPPLVAALLLPPLLARDGRRLLRASITVAGGVGLFLATYMAYSTWAGIPASATFSHSSAAVASALSSLPQPTGWRHLTNAQAMEGLLAVFYGPLALALYGAYHALREWLETRRVARAWLAVIGAGVLLAVLCSAAYLVWQGVGVLSGLSAAVNWLPAYARRIVGAWSELPFMLWLAPSIAACAILATVRDASARGRALRELATFGIVLTADVLLAGWVAWGYPKYIAPAYPVLVLLLVLLVGDALLGRVAQAGYARLVMAAVAVGMGLVLLIMPSYGCNTRDPRTGLCPLTYQGPALLWFSAFAALLLVALAGLAALPGSRAPRASGGARLLLPVAPLVLVGLVVLLALPEIRALATTTGSVAYNPGAPVAGMPEAAAYVAQHAAPGDVALGRKDIFVYTPTVRYYDDDGSPAAKLAQLPHVRWVVRQDWPVEGFREVARFGAWGIYERIGPA